MEKIFRVFVVANVVAFSIYVIIPYIDSIFHSNEALDILAYSGYGAIIKLPSIYQWFSTLIWLPVSLGMFYYNSIARTLFLVLTIFFALTSTLHGFVVLTGYEVMVYEFTTLLDGVILTMAYFTSVSEKFKKA